jgi:hypothetical protein
MQLIYQARLSLQFVLNNAPENWTGGTGFVTSDMIEQYMPEGGPKVEKSKVLLCGMYKDPSFVSLVQTGIVLIPCHNRTSSYDRGDEVSPKWRTFLRWPIADLKRF